MGNEALAVVRLVVTLLLVIGAMLATFFWLKRRGGLPGAAQKRMRVVERLPIDSRRSILLLQVDGEEIVVGVGNDTLSPITRLGRRVANEA